MSDMHFGSGPEGRPTEVEEAADVSPEHQTLLGITLVVCPKQLEDALAPMVKSAAYEISIDATLADALAVFGPQCLPKASRWKLLPGMPDSRRVRDGFRTHLKTLRLSTSTQVALGVLVVGQDVSTVEERLERLAAAPEFAGLPLHLRGISLQAYDGVLPAGITAVDPSLGPVRLDSLMVQICRAIVEQAQTSPKMVVPAGLLTEVIGEGSVATPVPSQITAARLLDDNQPEAAHSPASHQPDLNTAEDSKTPLVRRDRYAIPEGLPLRLTYIVVALSAESRPKHVRQRLEGLVLALDQGLVPEPETIASRTWLVAAGQATTRDPVMRLTGTFSAQDLWRASSDFLDMTQTMKDIARLVSENIDSFGRRNQPLVRPLVLFVMPTASLPGARCQSYYRQIKSVADVGWLITDKDAPPPSTEIDQETLVADKDDVVNELLYAVGYPAGTGAFPAVDMQSVEINQTDNTGSELN